MDYQPDDLIKLGQVIKDPRIPYVRLAPPLPLEGPLTPRTSQILEWSAKNTATKAVSVGAFAHIINVITAEASGGKNHNETQTWEAALLETQFIELSEDPKYVERTVNVDAVKQWLKDNRSRGRTVYMITGLKIAKDPGKVTYDTSDASDISAKLKATLDPYSVVEAGGEATYKKSANASGEGKPGTAYVFAYRLRKIYVTWLNKARLEEYCEGGDLFRAGHESHEEEEEDEDEREEDSDLEIGKALFEPGDFGTSLPSKDIKVQRVDEDDGGHYLAIQATTV